MELHKREASERVRGQGSIADAPREVDIRSSHALFVHRLFRTAPFSNQNSFSMLAGAEECSTLALLFSRHIFSSSCRPVDTNERQLTDDLCVIDVISRSCSWPDVCILPNQNQARAEKKVEMYPLCSRRVPLGHLSVDVQAYSDVN
jgi:hypothetical protein